MDSRRCISYLTIELKGPIPKQLRPAMTNRIFGCDICQEVCPWNQRFAVPGEEEAYRGGRDTDGPELVGLMGLSEEEFSARFSGSPVNRAKRRGLLRNVAVALGNWLGSVAEPPEEAVAALMAALNDPEPLVRGHVAWALGRALSSVGAQGPSGSAAVEALGRRLNSEEDSWVREELEMALNGSDDPLP
jgi:epoxyqueuosine reductase